MSILKPKIFIPLCLAGIITGYSAAEYLVPRYFHPTAETQLTTEDIMNAIGSQPYYFRQTTSGSYLAGQFAQRHKDWDKAAEYMSRVIAREKENVDLQKHSMIVSMAAGQYEDAFKTAKRVLEDDPQNILGALFITLEAFEQENYGEALRILRTIEENNIAAFIVPSLKLWANAGQQKMSVENLPKNSFNAYQALLAGNLVNKKKTAITYADDAFNIKDSDIRDLEQQGDAFLVYGRVKKAIEIYSYVEDNGFANPELKTKLKNLETSIALEKEITLPNITKAKQGAALVFQDMGELLLREYSEDSASIFAQMAIHLNPKLYKSYSIIGEVFQRYEQYDDAIRVLKKIDSESELYSFTQRQIAELYSEKEENQKAIDILNNLYDEQDDIDALIQIGDIYRLEEDFDKAIATYDKIISKWDKLPDEYWHVLYGRGIAYEQTKQMRKSEDDLKLALEYRPDNPYILNYLGYSWVDQGINLDESLKMISRAVAFKPNDGYITDSLGWAFYKMGEYNAAIPHLERAVALLPYDATINDHLGDAYWQVDRKNEARFQWRRALNYNEGEDVDLSASLKNKLSAGLTEEMQSDQKLSDETVKPVADTKAEL